MKNDNMSAKGFTLKQKDHIKELNADAYFFRHDVTGAELFYLHTDDDNKVFAAGFNTIPTDDTGVAHILEHCVLCQSKKYPVKELFGDTAKNSLPTFINAMTFQDKTIYPVASANDKGFHNMVDIYLDSVFHPTIYDTELFFRQEGHTYDLDKEKVAPGGVVYSEMRGAMASPERILFENTNKLLFDNAYKYNSGGNPEDVLKLTYKQFTDFHKKHYHPSNCRFYLYGNCDLDKVCGLINESIGGFSMGEKVDEPTHETYEGEPKFMNLNYSTQEESSVGSISFVIGSSYDSKRHMIASAINDVIFNDDASPLRKHLLESGYAAEITAYSDRSTASVLLSIALFGLAEMDEKKLEEKILAEIKNIDRDWLNKAFKAELNRSKFTLMERDPGKYPAGLLPMYGILLHRKDMEDPFHFLRYENTLAELMKEAEEKDAYSYLEEFFLKNNHRATIVLKPVKGMEEKEDTSWETLSEEEKEIERKWHKELRAYQDAEISEEAAASLPKVRLTDIPKEYGRRDIERLEINLPGLERPLDFLYYKLDTEIVYLELLFEMDSMSKDDISATSAGIKLLGANDTENKHLQEISYLEKMYAGGLSFSLIFREKKTYLSVRLKTLKEHLGKNLNLIAEILKSTKFDAKRFEEIVKTEYTNMQQEIVEEGNRFASGEVMARFDEESVKAYYASGLGFYKWLKDSTASANSPSKLAERAEELVKKQVNAERLTVSMGGNEEAEKLVRSEMASFINSIGTEKNMGKYSGSIDLLKMENTAFSIPADVNFVCIGAKTEPATGFDSVLNRYIDNEYLWQEIRMKGGAYGMGVSQKRNGVIAMHTFRDPQLSRSLDVLKKAPDFILDKGVDKDKLESSQITVISAIDRPLSKSVEYSSALHNLLKDVDSKLLKKERDEVLSCNEEDIKNSAKKLKAAFENLTVSVIGSAAKIDELKDVFDQKNSL